MRKLLNMTTAGILMAVLASCTLYNDYKRKQLNIHNYTSSINAAIVPVTIPERINTFFFFNDSFPLDQKSWEKSFSGALKTTIENKGLFKSVAVVEKMKKGKDIDWEWLKKNGYEVVFVGSLVKVEHTTTIAGHLLVWPMNFCFPPGIFCFIGLPTAFNPSADNTQHLIVNSYNVKNKRKIWQWDSGNITQNRWQWGTPWRLIQGYFETNTAEVFDKFEEALRTFPEDKIQADNITRNYSSVESPKKEFIPGNLSLPRNYKPPQIAVWRFTPMKGISPDAVDPLTETLRASLLKSRRFNVIARGEMGKIMKEQEISLSDSCDTTDCAVEYGKMLSVEKFVVGSVAKFGRTYQVVVKLIDVNSAKIEKIGSKRKAGDEDVLFELVEEAGKELCR